MSSIAMVYILANRKNGTLYVGATGDPAGRMWTHRNGVIGGFTKRYGVTRLVWYEATDSREAAFAREKQIKEWQRAWKIRLIEERNPEWRDLYPEVVAFLDVR